MSDDLKNGLLMPAELTAQVREKYYFVDEDPFTKTKRLFFDNSGGSFRLKAASEAFQKVDDLPNCGGHGGAASNYLDTLRDQACKDISTMFNAEDGCICTSMTASIIIFDVSEAIIENVPGTNVVTTALEHPSAYDGCAVPAKKFGKELRVAKTDPRTGTIKPEDVIKLIDQDTCLLSVIMTSNITGAILDIETIAREARKIKPDIFIVCDSVQHTPHGLTDMKEWGLDCVNFAPYKFGGLWGGQLQRYRNNKALESAVLPEGEEEALPARVVRLSEDMMEFAEEPRPVIIVDENGKPLTAGDTERRFFEASWVHKYNGKYYFSYSTGDTHLLCYAIGDNPYGPFTYQGVILTPVVGWTTHHAIVEFKGKWYLFHHDCVPSEGKTWLRSLKVCELQYDADGRIITIEGIDEF